MGTFEILVLLILGIICGVLVYALFIRSTKTGEVPNSVLLLQRQMQEMDRTLREQLRESTQVVNHGTQRHQDLMRQINEDVNKHIHSIQESINQKLLGVQKGVAEVSESSRQVYNVAEQLQNLEKVLKHQKQRGNLGEASLRLVLENILPATAYTLQYRFTDGDTVDAVVKTKDGLIPIDAKFSLDNYRRLVDAVSDQDRESLEREFKQDLKKRIDETAKYIRPKDDTLPFAFMFIPAEAIYYDLLVNEVGSIKVNTRSLIDYAYNDKNVIIVSPTTFSAYLQSVLYGFRAFKVEESAKEIQKNVEKLTRHLEAYNSYFLKLGNSLNATVNHFNSADRELSKIDKDVVKIAGESFGHETLNIDRPTRSED